ncbi:MAG TPA: apolipoprotein N-acyltransferase [Lacipirellulaceae bacterium]|nr:apolipoprotein N-acyltransferase [Lacipirellulaceae bacterium]
MSSAEMTLPLWRRSTLVIALVGSFLMWAALPPLALSWLAWIAPVPWLVLIRMDALPGRRPYQSLYLAGFAFWLVVTQWLRLAHPAVIPLWFLLSAYLGFYLPVFVAVSRVAVHRYSMPLWIAAPVVWTGLELARAHLLTGFLMASLAHTQVHATMLIQISDLVGEYGVDFVVMLTAACIVSAFWKADSQLQTAPTKPESDATNAKRQLSFRPVALLPAVLVLAATLGYGAERLHQASAGEQFPHRPIARVALIQGNALAYWKLDEDRQRQIMDQYVRLSEQAVAKARRIGDGRPLNLIVWPETMYRNPLREFEPGFVLPSEAETTTEEITSGDRRELANLASHLGTPLMVGIDRYKFLADNGSAAKFPPYRAYNAAVLVEPNGRLVGSYDKMHLVMFGEYVPLAGWLPFLNRLSTLTGNVEAGAGPVAMCTGGVCYIPSICYETVFPHVIRDHVATLEANSERPGALVNLTNDAWYWGSSGLDLHLDCGVFRAVETRLPLIVAANGGISAWIDHLGRIRAQSPRMQQNTIIADIEQSNLKSIYVRFGDWFSGACLAFSIVLAVAGRRGRRR